MELGLDVFEHYSNLVDILAESMARLYEVYDKYDHIDPVRLNKDDRVAIEEIIKYSAKIDELNGDSNPSYNN
ncbi:MAG: hypothetical protein AB8B95_08065 [Pseudohongiellaceae bacterium]